MPLNDFYASPPPLDTQLTCQIALRAVIRTDEVGLICDGDWLTGEHAVRLRW